jgi:hypothetical protein
MYLTICQSSNPHPATLPNYMRMRFGFNLPPSLKKAPTEFVTVENIDSASQYSKPITANKKPVWHPQALYFVQTHV